jgi:hypothetical protein
MATRSTEEVCPSLKLVCDGDSFDRGGLPLCVLVCDGDSFDRGGLPFFEASV